MKRGGLLKQLHIVQSVAVDFGGLGLAALRYAQAVAARGMDVSLYVLEREKPENDTSSARRTFRIEGGGGSTFVTRALALKQYFDTHSIDVVHIHGTWVPLLAVASYLANFRNIPVVISPHGCLEPVALSHRRWKKKLALAIYQRRIYSKAALMVATAKPELQSIRRLVRKVPLAVMPHGVDTPSQCIDGRGKVRKLLFLSRIHPIKGLADLVAAWSLVRREGWKVVVAGPDEGGHVGEIREKIGALGLVDDFEFPGLVAGDQKEKLFSEAEVFVLPTHSENFGIVIAEALSRGVPVITTTGAPWEEISTWRCGWWVAPGVEGIAGALVAAMNTPREELNEMGQRGMQLVRENYSWERIGRSACEMYQWILGQRKECPDFVYLES
ncbi:MAG: glycosyltransferase [Betaproteobacteria bacterium]|nr:glycosyltransferase [Betaproteobacteria bacterium]